MDVGERIYSAREPSYIVMGEDGRAHYGRRPRVVELRVPMCCAKCEEKVRESLLELEGVQGVAVDPATQGVTVTGLVDPRRALKKARAVKRDAHLMTVSGPPPPHHHRRPFSASPYHAPVAASSFVHHRTAPSHHHLSYRDTPAPYVHHVASPLAVTNPYYVKHLEYDGYWH